MLQPTTQATTSSATRPRVINGDTQRPRVGNNNNNNNSNNVRPPRVDNTNTKTYVPPPRVLTPRATVHKQKYTRATRVYRIFGKPNRLVEHRGYISDCDKIEEYYNLHYQDVDNKEYIEEKIGTMLRPTERNTNIMRVLAATKHALIIKTYVKKETIYSPPSQFSKGFSKAMECLEMMALEAVNTEFGAFGGPHYHYANLFIDEEKGNVMNLKKTTETS